MERKCWWNTTSYVRHQNPNALLKHIDKVDALTNELLTEAKKGDVSEEYLRKLLKVENITSSDIKEIQEYINSKKPEDARKILAKIYSSKENIKVDVVSKSTLSKISYLRAVENALKKSEDKKKGIVSEFTDMKLAGKFKYIYNIGEKLDLSDLAVNLIREDKTSVRVPYAEFGKYNIAVDLHNKKRPTEEIDKLSDYTLNRLTKQDDLILKIQHPDSGTEIEQSISVNKKRIFKHIRKLQYMLDGESTYKEINIPKNTFLVKETLENDHTGKKIVEVKLYDQDDQLLTTDSKPSTNDYIIEGPQKEFSINLDKSVHKLVENSTTITNYSTTTIVLRLTNPLSPENTVSKFKIAESGMPTKTYYAVGDVIDIIGLKVDLLNSSNKVLKTVELNDLGKHGLEIFPKNGDLALENYKPTFFLYIKYNGQYYPLENVTFNIVEKTAPPTSSETIEENESRERLPSDTERTEDTSTVVNPEGSADTIDTIEAEREEEPAPTAVTEYKLKDGTHIGKARSEFKLYSEDSSRENIVSIELEKDQIMRINLDSSKDDKRYYEDAKEIFKLITNYQDVYKLIEHIEKLDELAKDFESANDKQKAFEKLESYFDTGTLNNDKNKLINTIPPASEGYIIDPYVYYRELIADEYATKNSIDIDAISGSTRSKLSILKATKDALDKAKIKK